MNQPAALEKVCDCGCLRRFVPPPYAPHKRFATAECRQKWHLQQRNLGLQMLQQAAKKSEADPRDPRPDAEMEGKAAIFRDYNCWKCQDGTKPCPNNYHNCEYPHARND